MISVVAVRTVVVSGAVLLTTAVTVASPAVLVELFIALVVENEISEMVG